MKAIKGEKERAGQGGFTLVEAMVAMVIAVVVGMSLYYLYNHQQKQYLAEKSTSEMQENSRFILDAMGRDLIMTGYRPAGEAIVDASSDRITFEYRDEKTPPHATYDYNFRITYRIDTTNARRPLLREVQRHNPAAPPGSEWTAITVASTSTIGEFLITDPDLAAPNAPLQFQYYDKANNLMTPPGGGTDATSVAKRADIRNIRVQVTVRSFDPDPFTKLHRYTTLTRTFQARNLGIVGTPVDATPPDAPAGLQAADPGICNTLNVRWTGNTEPDLNGYTLFLGQQSGIYNRRINLAANETDYTFSDLVSTMSDGAPVTYYLAIAAFDKSANQSALSSEISGNPIPSVGDFSVNDTTLNPVKPFPPGTFKAADGDNNQTVLTWTPTPSTDGASYRLYRCPRVGYPDPAGPNEDCSAFPNLVGSALDPYLMSSPDISRTQYLDEGLIGCTTHYYKIATVNCDTSLVSSYLATEYSRCFGDGVLAGADFPEPNVTDSHPRDETAIDSVPEPVPVLSSVPGWKRVQLTLKNPNFTDDPDFSHTNIWFSTTGYPQFVPGTCMVDGSSGRLIPDSYGIFRGESQATGNSFKHDSEYEETPLEPSLTDLVTYYYLAVSYDRCGNCTSFSDSATTLSHLCGDDPLGLPQCSPNITLNVNGQGCAGYARLAWDGDCLKEGVIDLNIDFSGFHVFRSEGATFNPSTAVELTNDIPQWFQTYTDATLQEGKLYSYAVKWADCAYEHRDEETSTSTGNISNPDVNGGKLEGISLGRIDADNGNRMLTGDLSLSPPTYKHSSVTFYIKNTSKAPLAITSMNLSWQNQQAFLKSVVIGDNATTTRETVWERTPPLTLGYLGGPLTFTKLLDGTTDPEAIGGDAMIPVTLYFALADGTETPQSDMREDTINIFVSYTNTSTGSTGCARSGVLNVPAGPVVYRVTQDMPASPTEAWPVPGYNNTNLKDQVVVPGGALVNVFANVADNSLNGISSVKLFYYIDTSKMLTAPPAETGTYASPVIYTPLDMVRVSGDLWQLYNPLTGFDHRIPVADNASVWYYLVAVDGDGNFDRDPEVQGGAYQYYQQQGSVCSNTPNPPSLSGHVIGSDVELTWAAPTHNTNGTLCNDLQGYKIFRMDQLSNWVNIKTINNASTLSWTDLAPPNLATQRYYYKVVAYDTCAPTENESRESNYYAECAGESPCTVSINPSATSHPGSFWPGDTFGIILDVCGSTATNLWVQDSSLTGGDADPIRMRNNGWGTFTIDSGYYGGQSVVSTYLQMNYPPLYDNLDLYLSNGGTDTIDVLGYYAAAPSDSAREAFSLCQATLPVGSAASAPTIGLSALEIVTSSDQGTDAPVQSFEVWNSGGGNLNYQIAPNVPWISVNPAAGTSATERDTITVMILSSTLLPGTYSGTILVSDPAATNDPQTIFVSLTVATVGPPVIAVSPYYLTANAKLGTDALPQTIQVWNSGPRTLDFVVSSFAPWISFSPAVDSSTGPTDKRSIVVSFTTWGLPIGTYSADIVVSSTGALNDPQVIPVTLTISETAPAVIALSTDTLSTSAQVNTSPPVQTFQVWNSAVPDGNPLSFMVEPGAPWLTVNPANGVSLPGGGDRKTVNVIYHTASLAPGTYTASITVSDLLAANSPQQITVRLRITTLGPAAVAVSTGSITDAVIAGSVPPPQSFQVWNSAPSGSEVLNYALNVNWGLKSPWFTLSSAGGTSTGATDRKTVTLTFNLLPAGIHTAIIRVSDPNALPAFQDITVSIDVSANPCLNPLPPAAPTGLTATAAGNNCNGNTVSLSWTAPAGGSGFGPVDYYEVSECNGDLCTNFVPVATRIYTTSFQRTVTKQLDNPQSKYRWAVKAVNAQCASNIQQSVTYSNIADNPCKK